MEIREGNILEGKFSRLALADADPCHINGDDRLLQVEKAVDAAQATINQQLAENHVLRTELKRKNEELEKYKSVYVNYQSPVSDDQWGGHKNKVCGDVNAETNDNCFPESVSQTDILRSNENHEIQIPFENHEIQIPFENQFDSSSLNGSLDMFHDSQVAGNKTGAPHTTTSLSGTLCSPARYNREVNSESKFTYSGTSLNSIAEVKDTVTVKQDIILKIQEQEKEILQLKKYLTEFSIKEAKISNEKYAMEKRISHMRLAFDQQQQDLVLAASKAVSYRQDIMEENVHLTYSLQAAKEEGSTFVDSLMPLLAEYALQPPIADAQSIVSNVKVLFRHLQEQLLATQGKVKESRYQLAPWRSELKNGLELVPQPSYSSRTMPSESHVAIVEDSLNIPQAGQDDCERNTTIPTINTVSNDMTSLDEFGHTDPYRVQNNEGIVSRKVTFGDLVRSREMNEPDNLQQGGREPSFRVNFKATTSALDDPNSSYSPYLPPVLEEPSSSFSEAADDDPLPAIEGLQILGEAYPGQELQACGYSVNGTTSCNFEWVRHLEDGSFSYVDGAKKPTYLVTADDVDSYLAIEVHPLDNRKRKGELVKVFANEHKKIACDAAMLNCIEKTLFAGHTSFRLLLSTGYLDLWEPAILAIKRDGYSIKCSGASGGVVAEKFSPSISVSIPYGSPTEFSIIDSTGTEHILRADDASTDISCSRETIVLTLRLFILKAGEKKKGKKRSLFFNM